MVFESSRRGVDVSKVNNLDKEWVVEEGCAWVGLNWKANHFRIVAFFIELD